MKRVIGSHSRRRIGAAVPTKRGTKIAQTRVGPSKPPQLTPTIPGGPSRSFHGVVFGRSLVSATWCRFAVRGSSSPRKGRPEERTNYSRRLLSENGCDFRSATTAANPGLMAKLPWSRQLSTGVTLPEGGGEESCGSIRPSKPRE